MWLLLLLSAHAADIGGLFTLSSTPTEVKSSIDAGIDASVRGLPRMMQSTARSRLQAVPQVCETYAFRMDDAALSWQCDGQAPLVVPRASFGTPVQLTRDGKSVSVTATLDGDALAVRFVGDEGQRKVTFTFSDAGMVARSTVENARLSTPLKWVVRYAREVTPTP